MRDFSVVIGCLIGLALIVSLVASINTAAQQPTDALEIAQLRADVAAAQSETKKVRTEADKLKSDLKKANDNNQVLSKRISELERQRANRALKNAAVDADHPMK